jgi:hypothetical protein
VRSTSDFADWLLETGDKVLRLEPKQEWFEPSPDHPGCFQLRADRDFGKDHIHYMDRPLRGVVLDWVVLKIRRAGHRGYGIRGLWESQVEARIRTYKAWRRLSRSRELSFKSMYIHEHPVNQIEGYFDLEKGRDLVCYHISIWSASYPALIAESEMRIHGEAVDLQSWTSHEPTLLSPTPTLDEAIVKDILNKWYTEKFSWKRGHWTWREKKQPLIVIDLEWAESEGEPLPPDIQRIRS